MGKRNPGKIFKYTGKARGSAGYPAGIQWTAMGEVETVNVLFICMHEKCHNKMY